MLRVRTPDDLCSCFGVVWLNGCFNNHLTCNSYTHLVAQLGGVPSRGWTSCRWCSLARFSGGVASRSGTTQTLERSSGTRQLRNLCKDAIQIPHLPSELRVCLEFKHSKHANTNSSYLVDPASSHMLVLKIKPCMSKYKHLYRETANGSLKQLWFIWWFLCYLDNRSNSRANTCTKGRLTKPCIY